MKAGHFIGTRARTIGEAKDCFLKAAAALTEIADAKTLAFAFTEAAVGLLRLAEADPKGAARALVEKRIRFLKGRSE